MLLILSVNPTYAITRYMALEGTDSGDCTIEACRTIRYALVQMAGGDTLELADGVYSGAENMMDRDTYAPPSGPGTGSGDSRFTIIKAQNEGQVTIDGGDNGAVISWSDVHRYIKFEGIKFTHSKDDMALLIISAGDDDPLSDHLYFRRCGFYRTEGRRASTLYIKANYNLFEECYFFGAGRYGINLRTPGDHSIVRRCVFRMDDQGGSGYVIAAAISYEHDYIEWQNNIVLDTDREYWHNYTYPYGGILTHRTADGDGTHYNNFRGNIFLNLDTHCTEPGNCGYGIMLDGTTTTNCRLENNVFWDIHGHGIQAERAANHIVKNNTVGQIKDSGGRAGDGIRHFNGPENSVYNNIVYGCRGEGLLNITNADFNNVYGNGDDYHQTAVGPHDFHDSPLTNGLTFLMRIEPGSNLKTAGQSGNQIGAEIIKRYGKEGSFWGEPGYDLLQDGTNGQANEDLWPFPYEDQMKTDFVAYNPDGIDPTKPDGKRGFCSDGKRLNGIDDITLTSYIWEYLGMEYTEEPARPGPPLNLKIVLSE